MILCTQLSIMLWITEAAPHELVMTTEISLMQDGVKPGPFDVLYLQEGGSLLYAQSLARYHDAGGSHPFLAPSCP